jgi:aminoglycoside N3'-acetyltransferase
LNFAEFQTCLDNLLPADSRPIVAYTGLFSIVREFPGSSAEVPGALLSRMLNSVGDRTLLMPTYTRGFTEGRIDLDSTECNTGMMNELFRGMPGVKRTRSAFFSFAVRGQESEELALLAPRDAWGAGSVFEWIYRNDAQILMLGVPWPMCSFLHYAEWKAQVPYRYIKTFTGECVVNGKSEHLEERLFVRSLAPPVNNEWIGLAEILLSAGMRRFRVGRGFVSTMAAQALHSVILPLLKQDPFSFVRNRETVRANFEGRRSSCLTESERTE